jgi:hypothetical protein
MELGTFKRLDDSRVIVDGLVWCNDPEKAIDVRNEVTGNKAHSIKLDDVYYYPCAIYVPKKIKK